MKTHRSSALARARHALFTLGLFTASVAFAGPPMICRAYDIGTAASLPGGSDGHGVSAAYDRTQLVADTLAVLKSDTPLLVRMETLRRAAVYATNGMKDWDKGNYPKEDRALAAALLERLRERAGHSSGDARTLAVFDVGFFAETLRQTRMDPNLDGYPLLVEVATARPNDAEVAFALALASVSPQRKEHAEHLARARATAKPGSLLAANIDSHFGRS
jgi:hypothetical protein